MIRLHRITACEMQRHRLLVCSWALWVLLTMPVAAQQDGVHEVSIPTLTEMDSLARVDVMGATIAVTGVAVLASSEVEGALLFTVLEADGASIRVMGSRVTRPVLSGDRVRAIGIVREQYGELFIRSTSYEILDREPTLQTAMPSVLFPTIGLTLLVMLMLGFHFWRMRDANARGQRSEALFCNSPTPLLLTDSRWKIVQANDAACEMLGYTQDQITLQTLRRLLNTEADLEPQAVRIQMQQTSELQFTGTVVQDGEGLVDFSAITRKVLLNGQSYLLTSLQDITKPKEDHRVFRRFHEQLVDKVPLEIAVLTKHGQYLYANEAAVRGPQWRNAMIGNTDIEFCQQVGFHPEIALRRRSHRRHAIAKNRAVSFEETLPGQDGDLRHLTRIYSPILDAEGNTTAVAFYGVDMTDVRLHQEQVKEMLREAERVSQLKDTFLTNISHEVRTPLTGILGSSQILQEEAPQAYQEYIEIIELNARRLMTTLNAMLDLSRLQSDFLQMTPQVTNLVEEVKEVGKSVAATAKEKGLFLRMRAARPEILVRVDRSCLSRVLENLLGNAVKFTDSGGVLVEVDGDDEKVYVRVMDSGVGMQDEFLPNLFKEFNQESNGLVREYEGVGIGLTVAKRLLDVMQGHISVDTEKGEGTTFVISFPAAFPQAKSGKPNRTHLLIADENEEVIYLMQDILSPYFEVTVASNLDGAIDAARETRFDAVIIDVTLSDVDSASEVLVPLREIPGYAAIPVIAMDPHAHFGGQMQYLSIGFDASLHKPIEKQNLLNTIGEVMANGRRENNPAIVPAL